MKRTRRAEPAPAGADARTAPARVLDGAVRDPDAVYLRYLPTGEVHTERVLTRGALAARSRQLAALLLGRGHRGARALLVFPPGLEFPVAFFGSMLAGVVAVPAYTPDPSRMDRSLRRLRAIIGDAGATVVLTTAEVKTGARELLAHAPDLAALDWIAVDELDAFEIPAVPLVAPDPEDLAFLQYTSGSTGDPKGVEITHANIVHNVNQVWNSAGRPDRMSVVGWVPVHHDMGLVSTVLWQLWHGGETTLLSPVHFVQRPLRWLEAIQRWKANYSPAPTFGYDLVARKATDAEVAALDLSGWAQAVVSAEPVRWVSLEAFARRFAPSGFRIEQFNPCFGLAESTVIVSGSDPRGPFATRALDPVALDAGRVVDAPGGRVLVGSGKALDADLVVVDPESGRALPDDAIGEIWVASRSIGRGYWGRPEESQARFGNRLADDPGRGPFLRTGDLGFLDRGELYVSGRAKDLIIVAGANVHPHDVETAAERADAALRPGCSAAFGLERDGTEAVALAVEVDERHAGDLAPIHRAVRRAVLEHVGVALDTLIVLPRGRLPKTSSGKIQRGLTRDEHLGGRLRPLAVFSRPAAEPEALRELWTELVGEVAEGASFFEAGGRSLDLLRLIEQIREVYGVVVTLEALLARPTAEGMAEVVAQALDAHRLEVEERDLPADGEPATASQHRMWLLHQTDGRAYLVGRWTDIRGPLDRDALARAVDAVVARHPGLRTAFRLAAGGLVQVPQPSGPALELVDLTSAPDPEAALAEITSGDALMSSFDLESGRVARFVLARLSVDEHRLLVASPHVTGDAWTVELIGSELWACYAAGGDGGGLPPVRVTPARAAAWEALPSVRARREAQVDAWVARLEGSAPTELPTEGPRPLDTPGVAGQFAIELPDAELEPWIREARARGGTPFSAIVAAIAAMIHRTTGEGDLMLGAPVAGRSMPGSESVVGCFVNTVPLRIAVDPTASARALLDGARQALGHALADGEAPFAEVVARARPHRDAHGRALFRVMVNQLASVRRAPTAPGLSLTERPYHSGTTPFDLTFTVVEGERRTLEVEYDRERFSAEAVRRMAERVLALARSMGAAPDAPVARLPWVSADEAAWLERAWAGPPRRGAPGTLHGLVARAAARAPDALAVRDGEREVSYRELVDRADRAAAALRVRGARPGARVLLVLERSLDGVIALLAAFRAGAAAIMAPPSLPAQRLSSMLADGDPVLAVVASADAPRPAGVPACTLAELEAAGGPPVPEDAGPDDASFVFYTSGSTGRPNGVVIPHDGFVNRIAWMEHAFPMGSDEVCPHKTSLGFVDAPCEIFGPLAAGRPLVVLPDSVTNDPLAFVEALARHGATRIVVVPSVLRALLDHGGADAARLPRLRLWVCSGEALPAELAARFHAAFPEATLLNLYGSTEVSADATWFVVPPGASSVAIGAPIAGLRVRVEDAAGEPCPVGVPGELLVGGVGVAVGYHRRSELTAERFRTDADGIRWFRTRDRVLTLADGGLAYLGRLDLQAKIRGVRIDLVEVESALRRLPGVRDAAAAVLERNGTELAAFVVSDGPVSLPSLRTALAATLPDAAVPTALGVLPALPRLASGKIDRRALGQAPLQPVALRHVPPRTRTEAVVAEIWARLLGRERVPVDADFFAIGGHSLLAMAAVAELEGALETRIPPVWMLRGVTVERLAAWIDGERPREDALVPLQPAGSLTPLFVVHGIPGTVAHLAALAREFRDRPVFGVEARGVDGRQEPRRTVEEMAQAYAELIHGVHPRGPCLIAGYSFGGTVAWETAHRLAALGRQVPLVVLIDTRAPPSGHPLRRALWLGATKLRRDLALARRRTSDREEPDAVGHLRGVERANVDAWCDYRPRPWSGPVLWLRTQTQVDRRHPFTWHGLASDLRVARVPGNHVNCVLGAHAPVLADAIERALRDAGA